MNIIIKLDKRRWEEIQHTKKYEPTTMNWYEEQIANGIPLPEGHGRLIDADKLATIFLDSPNRVFDYTNILDEIYYHADTIIEADKTESEEV